MAAIIPEYLRGRRIGPWGRPDVSWVRTWEGTLPKGFYPNAAEVWERGTNRYQTYVFGPEGTEKGEFFPTLKEAQDFCDKRILDLWLIPPTNPPRSVWDRLDDELV